MKTEKISLFKPFKDMQQGFDKMIEILENMKNSDDKVQMLICYGCLVETYNQTMRKENKNE